jgi:thymidylate kinase
MKFPQLIVFEGVDAAGKSTVCDAYVKSLVKRDVTATLFSFPGKEPNTLGELVYRLHHNASASGIHRLTSASLQALHIAAHLDAIESTIVPSLERGETIVLDRYWWSTWVYGVVGGVDSEVLGALIEAERVAWGRWQPELVFLVSRSTPLREESITRWEQLRFEYSNLAEREKSLYPVSILSNDGKLEQTISNALAESHGF